MGELSHTHLDHALHTAAVLRQLAPQDEELWVAGLVHDIGHLLPGVGDAEHAAAGAAAVREALGERVAALVGLHVEAKRYLVGSEATYGAVLAADSVASLATQGGPMSPEERAAFVATPHWADEVALRRADEGGKSMGRRPTGWRPGHQPTCGYIDVHVQADGPFPPLAPPGRLVEVPLLAAR
jgi:predicted HD phosphohydrolase